MISFWIICALLIIVALIIILPSLLAKEPQADLDRQNINLAVFEKKLKELEHDRERDLIDEEQCEIAKADLQRTLIDDLADQKELILKKSSKILPLIVLFAVPVTAVLLYINVDNGLDSLAEDFEVNMQAQQPGQMSSVEEVISSLEQKIKQDPDNLDSWLLLGRSYLISESFDKSVSAYAKANQITKGANPNVLVDFGEAQVLATNQKFDEHSKSLFTKALQIDPRHERGLWYAGLAALQFEEYKSAVDYWETLMQQIPSDQEQAKSALQVYLNVAKQKAGTEITNEPSKSTGDKAEDLVAHEYSSITVTVTLSDAVQNKIVNSDTLFIYARALDGPKMPLALVRMTAGDLPATVTLDDSVSMMANMTLSSMEQVEVIARISKSGQAIMQSGDVFGSIQPVSTNQSEAVEVVISELAP